MKILFVCLGNICRSPMAEFILRDLCQRQGRRDIITESAATSSYEVGNPVYRPAREMLYAHSISCEGKPHGKCSRPTMTVLTAFMPWTAKTCAT